MVRVEDMNQQLQKLFQVDESILTFYKVLYWHSDIEYVKGFLSLTRHYIAFHADAGLEDAESKFNTLIAFKDVSNIEPTPSRRIFTPDIIAVSSTNSKQVITHHICLLYTMVVFVCGRESC
jgi:hypothetical protein